MPQWICDGEGVPVGASSDTEFVAVTTVVGGSNGVILAVSIGGSEVTMTSPLDVVVDVATSMGLSDGFMTRDAEDDVVIDGTKMVVGSSVLVVGSSVLVVGSSVLVVGSSVLVGGSSVLVGGSSVAVGRGTDVAFANVVIFPGASVVGKGAVGKTVTLTSDVLMLGKDVKLEGITTGGPTGGNEYEVETGIGRMVKFATVEMLTKVGRTETSPVLKGVVVEMLMKVGRTETSPVLKDVVVEMLTKVGRTEMSPVPKGVVVDELNMG
jgi:hypothetical protein